MKLFNILTLLIGLTLSGFNWAGSPGMGGTKSGAFKLYELSEGMPKVFAVE
jgi:hypothetical protein